jgi:hypothetical protein
MRPPATVILGVLLATTPAAATPRGFEATLTFAADPTGTVPSGFSTALTGSGGPVRWAIQQDATAPGGKVLAQTSVDRTDSRFPLCIYDNFTGKDVSVAVKFKAVSGAVDQAAGLVARLKDKNNYYVVRANALEDNVRLYKVVRGSRQQFAGASLKVPSGEWHALMLEVKGTHFTVSFDGRRLFEAEDDTFKEAGKVALWTKADSTSFFGDLQIRGSDAK